MNMIATHSPPDDGAPPALIFVIEDDLAVAKLVLASLTEFDSIARGFRPAPVCCAGCSLKKPDLCVVDLGLPDMEGIDLMRRITADSNTGVLILTGRGHTADRVMGLELGGDDYVTKPFESRELVARVRSIPAPPYGGAMRHGGAATALRQFSELAD